MKQYAERIKAYEKSISENRDAILAVTKLAEGDKEKGIEPRDLTETEMEQVNLAKANIDTASKNLDTLKAAQAALAVTFSGTPAGGTKGVAGEAERPLADLLFKSASARLIAYVQNRNVEDVADNLYGAKDATATDFIKSTVDPAMTTVQGWAQELMQTQYGEFMEALRPVSIYAQIAALGTTIPFGSKNSVTFPAEGATGGLAGSFVGEGNLIPVKKGAFEAITLTRHKMAVISNFSREVLRSSTPAIEALVRNMIIKDTAMAIDVALLDAEAASNVRPAGLLNGVTPVHSAGNTVANVTTDIKKLVSPIVAAGGNGAGIVILINEEDLLGLSTITTAAGNFAFRADIAAGNILGYKYISSTVIPKGHAHAVFAPALASSFEMPEFEVSNSAVLIQANDDSTKPTVTDYNTGDGHTLGAAASDSTNNPSITTAFQQDLIALRMIMPLAWGLRRKSNMVTSIDQIGW